MLLSRFKVLAFSSLFFSHFALANFGVTECLHSNFKTKTTHKGVPFGLVENILEIDKENCIISVNQERYKFIKKKWEIDVCRIPIHIKYGSGAIDVLKRTTLCVAGSKSDYCDSLAKLKEVLQDDGLIFAKGEKEDLSSDHGRVFCVFQLVENYLGSGIVYSRHGKTQSIEAKAPEIPRESTPLAPAVEEKDPVLENPVEEKVEEKAEIKEEKEEGSPASTTF